MSQAQAVSQGRSWTQPRAFSLRQSEAESTHYTIRSGLTDSATSKPNPARSLGLVLVEGSAAFVWVAGATAQPLRASPVTESATSGYLANFATVTASEFHMVPSLEICNNIDNTEFRGVRERTRKPRSAMATVHRGRCSGSRDKIRQPMQARSRLCFLLEAQRWVNPARSCWPPSGRHFEACNQQ